MNIDEFPWCKCVVCVCVYVVSKGHPSYSAKMLFSNKNELFDTFWSESYLFCNYNSTIFFHWEMGYFFAVGSSRSRTMRINCNALFLASLVTWSGVMCSTVLGTTEGQETPLALPVAEQTQPTTAIQGEVWEEDDHEVLIRNERGTKSDGESGDGWALKGDWEFVWVLCDQELL